MLVGDFILASQISLICCTPFFKTANDLHPLKKKKSCLSVVRSRVINGLTWYEYNPHNSLALN